MVTGAPAAPLTKRGISKDDVLRLLAKSKINNGENLFYQPYLNREYVLGTIGDRGGGKSGSDAVISIVDFMLRGYPVWSNMKIQCNISVSDESARAIGLNSGGMVHLESLPIDKTELLKLDETYRNGCLVIEEINVQYSNVRRFMSNTNIDFNEVCQQLRKFRTSLIYNVIDEMFIDPQLRALSDMFIRTYDTAFDLDAMRRRKSTGLDFCWQVYPMSGYLNGEQGKYGVAHVAKKCYFHFAPWRGVYDSMQHQEKGVYSLNKREKAALEKEGLVLDDTAQLLRDKEEYYNKWASVDSHVTTMGRNGVTQIERYELYELLGTDPEMDGEVDRHLLKDLHLRSFWSNGKKYYTFPPRLFDDKKKERAAARN